MPEKTLPRVEVSSWANEEVVADALGQEFHSEDDQTKAIKNKSHVHWNEFLHAKKNQLTATTTHEVSQSLTALQAEDAHKVE